MAQKRSLFWHSLALNSFPSAVTPSISRTMSAPKPYLALRDPCPPLERKPPILTVLLAPETSMTFLELAPEDNSPHWLPDPAVTAGPSIGVLQPSGVNDEVNHFWLLRLCVQMDNEFGWIDLRSVRTVH